MTAQERQGLIQQMFDTTHKIIGVKLEIMDLMKERQEINLNITEIDKKIESLRQQLQTKR